MPKSIGYQAASKLSSSAKKKKFDPEGSGYDYDSAKKYGMTRDEKTKHWQSREPKTGLLLKGRGHKTWHKTVTGEEKAGYEIYKKDGRYYSKKKTTPKKQAKIEAKPKSKPKKKVSSIIKAYGEMAAKIDKIRKEGQARANKKKGK